MMSLRTRKSRNGSLGQLLTSNDAIGCNWGLSPIARFLMRVAFGHPHLFARFAGFCVPLQTEKRKY